MLLGQREEILDLRAVKKLRSVLSKIVEITGHRFVIG
jgi:hypothetical protein